MAHENDTVDAFFCPNKILLGKMTTKTKKKISVKDIPEGNLNLFDWLAPHYDRLEPVVDPVRFQAHSVMLDILHQIDPQPGTILDLGIGTGMLAQQVLELFPEARLYGIDGSIQMLESARLNLVDFTDRITLARADFRDPWEEIIEEPMDVIVHYASLHHLPHHSVREIYTRLMNILKPGGWFLHGDITEQKLPEPVDRIVQAIKRYQSDSARMDLGDDGELLDEMDEIRRANEAKGTISVNPAMAEQQIAWLLEAGFEFAVRIFQDWHFTLFLARKPNDL